MELDLSDPGILLRADVVDDPRPLYDTLRRDAPVWQIPGQQTFVVSDPALIRHAVGRPEEFSSNLVRVLHNDGSRCPVAFGIAPFRDPIHVLSTADPPLHTRHRRLLQSHLSPAALAELEPSIHAIVDDYLDPVVARGGTVDMVPAFSEPVPARAICELIGLPPSDTSSVIALANGTSPLLDGITERDGMTEAITSAMELTGFVEGRLHEAVARPPGDRRGLFAVFAGGIEEGLVTAGEVRDMLVVLVTAGSETTASLIAKAIDVLSRNPALQEDLRGSPERIPAAIEDVLRQDGPFQFHYRYVPSATTLGGADIPADSLVLLMWAAANRPSPSASEELAAPAHERPQAPHFAFGRGLHFCIGSNVAKLEARIALEHLLARTTSLSPDHTGRPAQRPSIFIRRHASLPVVIEPALGPGSA